MGVCAVGDMRAVAALALERGAGLGAPDGPDGPDGPVGPGAPNGLVELADAGATAVPTLVLLGGVTRFATGLVAVDRGVGGDDGMDGMDGIKGIDTGRGTGMDAGTGLLASGRCKLVGELHADKKPAPNEPKIQITFQVKQKRFMIYILLEAFLAGMILVGIVWWTMFSGRPGGERSSAPDDERPKLDAKDTPSKP